MAISADVLATALNDYAPGLSETFMKWHPVFEKLIKKGNLDQSNLKGPLREFAVVAGGPGTVTEIATGSEVIQGGRKQKLSKGTARAPRLIYAFDVPRKDLDEANGEYDMARILKMYPELGMGEFHEHLSQQLVVGDGANNCGGFLTLNGDASWTPGGSTETGIFEYKTTATQDDTVHGLVKSGGTGGVAGWHNQFGKITSFDTDGLDTLRKAYYRCSRQSKTNGKVDIMLADEGTYHNYLNKLDDVVRVAAVENDHVPADVRQGIKFLDATMWLEDSLDITNSAFASGADLAQDGVCYMLNSETWEAFILSHGGKGGYFNTDGPFRIPEQDMVRYEIILYMGMYCNQLRANGVVTGGNQA